MNLKFSEIPSPCFVLEERALLKNLRLIDHVQKTAGAKIILALKAFSMFSTFSIIRKFLSGTTASSLNEARLGFEEFGGEVHAYSPAYPENEFNELVHICNHITFNSMNDYTKYKSMIKKAGKKISCGLRINPEYSEVKNPMYNPCVTGSRLGLRAESITELPEGIEGLHFHTLCECDSFALERTLKAVEEKFGKFFSSIKWLNFGGGHLMTRSDYDVNHLIGLLKEFKNRYPHLEIILEPGSAVGWQTGFLISTILDIIDYGELKTLVVDTSFSAHLPDCLEVPYKPVIRGATILENQEEQKSLQTYRIGGLTCLAGDWCGDYIFEKTPQSGDRIIFEDMIHYTMVKTTTFNGVNLPSIGIIRENGNFELVKKFGYADFRNRLS
ncbi:MAG: carboxynorspermidine decarboxylase [Bacteroidetes bacterium RIFCSPLOWO2_02_FULL_36_8]|nr:MAG: carboxynorspermidine decarboxylase [Bacteroidetes bacterium RIFCSPLOWO2_02_FULL_36_8]OFY69753.1 MAG: carboxynorspermidine decarboxylase [Bacteroidetes bacterium RIFCSPLOWO2_12_FULL_37_12]